MRSKASYVGKAGQLAIMAELAFRGYNVAIPEIDTGDDVFVLNDQTKGSHRIQVKTATARRHKTVHAYWGTFGVQDEHVKTECGKENYYAFVARCDVGWRYLIVATSKLKGMMFDSSKRWGTSKLDLGVTNLNVHFFDDGGIMTSTRPDALALGRDIDSWTPWPPLEPLRRQPMVPAHQGFRPC